MNQALITTLGHFEREQLGLILPHEHIFVDLSPIEAENWKVATAEPVITLMEPELQRAREAGVTALVECTPLGVGRRADIVRAVSEAANFPIVVPTGIYREPWVPAWAHQAPMEEIRDRMIGELTSEIENSGVQAGWIKLSAGDDGLTPTETKILRAAAQAGKSTGAVIGSHTIKGRVVREQLDILEAEGYTPERFIWIHTQADPIFDRHLEMARRGVWLEYDSIGGDAAQDLNTLENILRLLEAGLEQQLLLSHDRGWYDPSQPGGGTPRPFDFLSRSFLPRLQSVGVPSSTLNQLTAINPFNAFARQND